MFGMSDHTQVESAAAQSMVSKPGLAPVSLAWLGLSVIFLLLATAIPPLIFFYFLGILHPGPGLYHEGREGAWCLCLKSLWCGS